MNRAHFSFFSMLIGVIFIGFSPLIHAQTDKFNTEIMGINPNTVSDLMTRFLKSTQNSNFDQNGFKKGKHGEVEVKDESQMREEKIFSVVLAAQALIKENKNQDALVKLSELDAIPERSATDNFLIERTRVAIAVAMNDEKLLVKSMEAVVVTGQAPAEDQLQFIEILGQAHFNEKNFSQAIVWLTRYFKEGGNDPEVRHFLVLAHFFNNEFALAAQEIRADIQTEENAGKIPSEDQLKLLISCNLKLNDQSGYVKTMEKYVTFYPKKEYWADLLNRVLSKQDFSERLTLDVYRLMYATGQVVTTKDYVEMAELALGSRYPTEAKKVVDQGFQMGVLGKGPDATAHKHLRDMATKMSMGEAKAMDKEASEILKEKKGSGLFELGYGYVERGMLDKGIELMERGIHAGGLKYTNEARLHLGLAYVLAGNKETALQTLKTVQGNDGASDLARYWVIYLNGVKS